LEEEVEFVDVVEDMELLLENIICITVDNALERLQKN